MNLLSLLESGLFALGQVMRFPVIALLWLAVVAVLFSAGRCLRQVWLGRHRHSQFDLQRWLKTGKVLEADSGRLVELPLVLNDFVAEIKAQRAEQASFITADMTYLLLAREEKLRAPLQTARLLVKVGPSLGLIGTLIPMGTAMAAMAGGNLEAMAGQMLVAFTTTIVGIAVGAVAFVVLSAQQHWSQRMVRDLRYLAEVIADELDYLNVQTMASSELDGVNANTYASARRR